ncbi:hypothetical protein KKC52_06500 [bacterium]|nr:hypothetical protein [bacterium]
MAEVKVERKLKKVVSISLLSLIVLGIGFFVHKESSLTKVSNIAEKQISEPSLNQELLIADKDEVAKKPLPKLIVDKDTVAEKQPPTKPEKAETTNQEEKMPPGPMPQAIKAKVIAYYFHGTYRCDTCLTMERYSREVMEKYFAKELQDKRLEFKALNVEEPENMHYDSDYELPTISLVIALYRNGIQQKWKNLRDIWTYVEDKEKFYQYVRDETGKFLEEAR